MYILLDYTLYSWKKRGGNISPPTGPKTCSCHEIPAPDCSPAQAILGGTLHVL